MSTYHLPGKGIPAVLRRAAGLPHPGGSLKAKAAHSFYDGEWNLKLCRLRLLTGE